MHGDTATCNNGSLNTVIINAYDDETQQYNYTTGEWEVRNNDDIKRFCLENKNIINKSYSRMISYWNEFYRSKEPSFHKYIKKILKESLFFS